MKKIILGILASIALVVVAILIAATVQAPQYHIERSIFINAPTDKVFAIMTDLNRYDEWSPWSQLDPDSKKSVAGPAGVGQTYAWEGNDKVGAGSMRIASVDPGKRVDVQLEFLRPMPAKATTAWIASNEAGKTKATWSMDGVNEGLMAKTFSMLFMDSMLGKNFDDGLNKLKAAAERDAGSPQP